MVKILPNEPFLQNSPKPCIFLLKSQQIQNKQVWFKSHIINYLLTSLAWAILGNIALRFQYFHNLVPIPPSMPLSLVHKKLLSLCSVNICTITWPPTYPGVNGGINQTSKLQFTVSLSIYNSVFSQLWQVNEKFKTFPHSITTCFGFSVI